MNLNSLAPVAFSIASVVLHRVLIVKLVQKNTSPAWGAAYYVCATLLMFASFFMMLFKYSSSQAVVIGIYLGYNISYIVWGMLKSRQV